MISMHLRITLARNEVFVTTLPSVHVFHAYTDAKCFRDLYCKAASYLIHDTLCTARQAPSSCSALRVAFAACIPTSVFQRTPKLHAHTHIHANPSLNDNPRRSDNPGRAECPTEGSEAGSEAGSGAGSLGDSASEGDYRFVVFGRGLHSSPTTGCSMILLSVCGLLYI